MDEPFIPYDFLQTFMFCQRKLFLEEKLNFKKSMQTKIKQDILIKALKLTNRLEEGIVKSISLPQSQKTILENFKSSHQRALQEAIRSSKDTITKEKLSIIDISKSLWSDLLQAAQIKAKNVFGYSSTHRVYGNELWWSLSPKITFKLPVSSKKLGISMVVDRVDHAKKSTATLLYFKHDPPENGVWLSDKIKLIAAMKLLAENGSIVQKGMLIYPRKEISMELTPELEEELKIIISNTKKTIESSKLPNFVTQTKKCEKCLHKERCYDQTFMASKMQELRIL